MNNNKRQRYQQQRPEQPQQQQSQYPQQQQQQPKNQSASSSSSNSPQSSSSLSPPLLVPTYGSRLTYQEVTNNGGEAQNPPKSTPKDIPIIYKCKTVHKLEDDTDSNETTSASAASLHTTNNANVLRNVRLEVPYGMSVEDYPIISLYRDSDDVKQAYGIFEHKVITLNHHYPEWGCIYTSALVYPRIFDNNTTTPSSNTTTYTTTNTGYAATVGQQQQYERRNSNYAATSTKQYVFAAPPSPAEAVYVAIKKLNKKAVQQYLQNRGTENPYIEIARMQELGDNIHVLGCIEALQDQDEPDAGFLYIVMPQADNDYPSLKDKISWNSPSNKLDVLEVKRIFRKILQILLYLEQHLICHRDLSPDNFLLLPNNNIVVTDLALSIRIPTVADRLRENNNNNNNSNGGHNNNNNNGHNISPSGGSPTISETTTKSGGKRQLQSITETMMNIVMSGIRSSPSSNNNNVAYQRTLITDQGNFGTIAWMSPEIFHRRVFDGIYTDVWQTIVVLYNLLTGQVLYHRPDPSDIVFLYFILARGLSSTPVNEMTIDVLSQFYNPTSSSGSGGNQQQNVLLSRAMSHLALSPTAIELFENCFQVNVHDRWTLAQIVESNFVTTDD